MANIVFNAAKGRLAHYAGLPLANDGLVLVPLAAAGLQSDSLMQDHATLAAVLSANTEQTTMGRLFATGVTVTVNNASNQVEIDMDNAIFPAASGAVTGGLLVCYDPDTTTGTDSEIIPLAKYDFAVTPTGGDVTVVIGSTGFLRAS